MIDIVDSQRPSEINKRVSVYSDYEGHQNDERSIMMTKKISEVERKLFSPNLRIAIEAPKPTTLDKIASLKNQSPIRRKDEGMTDNSILQLRK